MTQPITDDIRIRRESQAKGKRYVYDFWSVEVYEFGSGWHALSGGIKESYAEALSRANYWAGR